MKHVRKKEERKRWLRCIGIDLFILSSPSSSICSQVSKDHTRIQCQVFSTCTDPTELVYRVTASIQPWMQSPYLTQRALPFGSLGGHWGNQALAAFLCCTALHGADIDIIAQQLHMPCRWMDGWRSVVNLETSESVGCPRYSALVMHNGAGAPCLMCGGWVVV